jgi:hypothetical protein
MPDEHQIAVIRIVYPLYTDQLLLARIKLARNTSVSKDNTSILHINQSISIRC